MNNVYLYELTLAGSVFSCITFRFFFWRKCEKDLKKRTYRFVFVIFSDVKVTDGFLSVALVDARLTLPVDPLLGWNDAIGALTTSKLPSVTSLWRV